MNAGKYKEKTAIARPAAGIKTWKNCLAQRRPGDILPHAL
jgi:hypothetical protein